ncbi:MAG: ribose-phosphate pyrophosphokinase [Bdellovibrionales bacterium]|nr:ribose-phosphate pyrophosphokinase [Bdellovibrionales bacterium]
MEQYKVVNSQVERGKQASDDTLLSGESFQRKASKLSTSSIIFTGQLSSQLAARTLAVLGASPGQMLLGKFPNSETRIEILESVRDKNAFVFLNPSPPVNESLVQNALVIQALKLAGAQKITAILPYFFYSRQDRRADCRPPISARAVTDILKATGAHHIVTIDVHARQIEGFFDGPFDNLEGLRHMAPHVLADLGPGLVVVSPDAGGSKRAEGFSRTLERISGVYSPLVVLSKFRPSPSEPPTITCSAGSEALSGKTCVLVDDMIDTGNSMIAAAQALKDRGARKVILCASHGILSNGAAKKLREAKWRDEPLLERMYLSDTIDIENERKDFVRTISLSPLLAEAISRLDRTDCSIGELNQLHNFGEKISPTLQIQSEVPYDA